MRYECRRRCLGGVARASVCVLAVVVLALPATAGAGYSLTYSSVTAGGGRSVQGPYTIIGAIGNYAKLDTRPAAADVEFVVSDVGAGRVRIGYATHTGDPPRTIALRINTATAAVQGPGDVVSVNAAFNGFLDYARSFPAGYSLGDGHPVADKDGPGVPDFGSGISEFCVNMACFDAAGSQAAGPMSTSNLVTLQLHGGGAVQVTVAADTLRGCSFVTNGQTTNLPVSRTVTLP